MRWLRRLLSTMTLVLYAPVLRIRLFRVALERSIRVLSLLSTVQYCLAGEDAFQFAAGDHMPSV